jgi:hypothetical protein
VRDTAARRLAIARRPSEEAGLSLNNLKAQFVVRFKCQMNRVDQSSDLFGRSSEANLVLESNQPTLGEGSNLIPHRVGPAIEFGEKTAPAKHDFKPSRAGELEEDGQKSG